MTTTAARPRRIGGLATATALAATVLVGGWASAVGAHEGGSIIEVDSVEPGPDGVAFVVEVTFEDDGHGAPDAVVTATASGPDGAEAGPVTLEVEDADAGLYGGVLELTEPGDWDVTFASLDPDGTLEHTETVEEAAGGDDAEDTTGAGDEGAEDGADGTAEDDADADADVEEDPGEVEPEVVSPDADPEVLNVEDADDDGPGVVVLVLVFVALAAVVAGAFWLIMSRRQSPDAGSGESGESGGSDTPDDTGTTTD